MSEKKKELALRRATEADCRFLFELRNDKTVRMNSFQTDEILYEQHEKWLKRKLASPDSEIYILLLDEVNVGQVRIDVTDGIGEISYALCSEARGHGYSKWMLAQTEQEMRRTKACRELFAEVKRENTASRKIFQSLEYREEPAEFGYCYRKRIEEQCAKSVRRNEE